MTAIPARVWLALSGAPALAALLLPVWLTPLRATVTTAFLLIAPGAAVVRLTHPGRAETDRKERLLTFAVYSVAFSVAVDTVTAEAFFFTRALSPFRAVAALAVLTLVLALWPARRRRPEP